jgi:adiponectin receptor
VASTPAGRAAAFALLWLGRVAVIVTTAALSLTHWPASWFAFHLLCEFSSCAGAAINVLRLPEKYFPGRFDYWLQSHQIMHACVAFSMLAQHYIGLDRAEFIHGHPASLQCVRDHWSALWGGF